MGRVKVNLTLDASVAETARALGLNMSRLAEAAISDAAKAERNRRWRIENQQALDTYAQEVEAEGLPLERFRALSPTKVGQLHPLRPWPAAAGSARRSSRFPAFPLQGFGE